MKDEEISTERPTIQSVIDPVVVEAQTLTLGQRLESQDKKKKVIEAKRKKEQKLRGKLLCRSQCTKQVEETFIQSKIEEDNSEELHLNLLFTETESENILLRCSKCFKSHFPHPRFCKLVLLKQKHVAINTKDIIKLSNDEIKAIQERINNLEHLEECTECSKDTFLKSILKTPRDGKILKLKGGHKTTKLPSNLRSFKSEFQLVNIVCNILRSLEEDWNLFHEHKLCSHSLKKETNFNCFFCYARSLSQRACLMKKTRPTLDPIEIYSQLNQYRILQNFDWTEENGANIKEMLTKTLSLMSIYEPNVSHFVKNRNCLYNDEIES